MGLVFAVTLPGLICLLFILAVLERIGRWSGRYRWIPWRKPSSKAVASIAFEEVYGLFYPTKQNEFKQRSEERMLREEEGDGAPPRSKVDLDAGTAVIKLPGG